MIHCLHIPKFPLDRFVENLWFHEGYDPDHSREKLLPEGVIEIIIDMHETPKKLYESGDSKKHIDYKGSWISGERKEFIVIEAGNHSSMMGIRFRPGGAWPFLLFPLSELTDRVVELDLIWGQEIRDTRERLIGAETIPDKFRILEEFLLEKAGRRLETDETVDYAIRKIIQSPQFINIRELADEVGFSQKHLISQFDKKVGVTPKVLTRIFKFQKVIRMIENKKRNGGIDWPAIAYSCGYYDQAHFIREFQAFSGINPTAYLEQHSPYLNYLAIE